jgi:predicted TIM-barrel fold metal-dependent hydrolase
MKVIDAQVHLWSQAIIPPVSNHRQVQSFSAEELLAEMAEAGVDGALIHPPFSWDPTSNALSIEACKKYPDRFAILGQFPPGDRSNEKLIATWRQQPGMLGMRWVFAYGDQPASCRKASSTGSGRPSRRRACRSHAGRQLLDKFRWIAETHPNLTLIIDHCGLKSGAKDEAALEHLDRLLPLARLPNVALKATGAPGYSTQPYPFRNLHDPLHRLFDAFGPDRFFWGTDITRMPCSYRQCVTFFTEELPWLKGEDLEKVMGRGLAKWIGWDFRF